VVACGLIDLLDSKIVVTGGAGFVGTMLVERLRAAGVASDNIRIPRSADSDLRDARNCAGVVKGADVVIHLAAKVGGIGLNQRNPGSLFYDNAIMGIQMMEASRVAGVSKFVVIGTVCAYPKYTPVPFKEADLWNGYPEETNAPYGLAKKMLLVQAQSYRAEYGFNAIYLLPVNLYGPRDNFDLESSHVIPAMIRKFLEAIESGAKVVRLWGTGNASREFLYVDDAAEGIFLATKLYDKPEPVNLGAGHEIRIRELAEIIGGLAGFSGEINWNTSKPDGQPRRMLDTSKAEKEFGFKAKTPLEEGLRKTIEWYQHNQANSPHDPRTLSTT
jgi:GDP-L-fucose synthase